ncbi:MAG: hypothetical protein IVW52_04940 [Acidimicrobiales bacterium]|nr:hypothetical protein [Acidimicrobiales bacterium]
MTVKSSMIAAEKKECTGTPPTLCAELDGGTFKAWLKVLAPVCKANRRPHGRSELALGELRIRTGHDGLRVVFVTEDRTALADVTLGRRAFAEYEAGEGDFCIDGGKLADFAGIVRRGEPVRLELDRDARTLKLGAGVAGHLTRACKLLGDGELRSDAKVPAYAPKARAVVAADTLARVVRDAWSMTDHLILEVGDGEVVAVARGETDSSETPIEAAEVAGSGKAAYPLDRLSGIVRAFGKSAELALEFSTDMPLRVGFELGGKDAGIAGSYLLAPRVEESEPERTPEPVPESSTGPVETDGPVDAPAAPEPVGTGPEPADPTAEQAETAPEDALPVPVPVEGCTARFREPTPVGQVRPGPVGAPDCAVCLGLGRVYSRRSDYPCPGCGRTEWTDGPRSGPAPSVAGPAAPRGWVESVRQAVVLAHGRDGS